MADPDFAAVPDKSGPIPREKIKEVCEELSEVIHIFRSLHHFARAAVIEEADAEIFALSTEHLAVRGIQKIGDCIEELGELPLIDFCCNAFEERRQEAEQERGANHG